MDRAIVDGVIASYSWNFGDGTTGTGSPASHSFPGAGDYTVVLTVTDDDGATSQRSAVVQVEAAPNVPPTASFSADCSSLVCSFDASSSHDGDGTIASYAWAFGDGATADGATPSHTFGAAGDHTVTLTVTDDSGATASTSQAIAVQALSVAFRASSSANGVGTNASVIVPAAVQAGDQLVLFVTSNVDTSITTPAGWTLLGTQVDGTPDVRSWVFTRTASAGLGGTSVAATLGSSASKSSRILLAYSGASAPTLAVSAVAGPSTTAHATPSVEVAADDSFVVSYWSDKSAGNAGWTLPGSVTGRQSSLGSGSGQITAAAGDSGPLDAGSWPGATATSSVSSAKSIEWSVVIPSGVPTAAATAACTGLSCTFDGSSSVDPDGSITSWAWTFGDGATGTGVDPAHTYAAAGTYDVTLTVTDDRGSTDSVTTQVTVAPVPNQAPLPAVSPQCIGLDCTFDGSGSTDGDGSIVGYAWTFGDGSGATTASATHTYAAAGSYVVTLTVTDEDGASASLQQTVTVSATLVGFRAASSASSATTNAVTTIPAGVQAGDQLILIVTVNSDTSITTPTGWTLLGTQVDGAPDMRSTVFTATATATSAGSPVTTSFGSGSPKSSRVILAYSGAAVPTLAASAVAGASTATHTTPSVTVPSAGAWVLSYWSDKSAGNTGWTLPGGVAPRTAAVGTGTGSITVAAGDSGPLTSGTWAGAAATSSVSSAKAVHWSIVIPSA